MELILIYSARMFGMSMVMMPVMTNGLNQLPARYNPHGTAMNSTVQQVSGAIGSALMVTIMSNRAKTHATDLAASAMKHLTGTPTPAELAEMKQQIAMKAMLGGINDAFLVSAGIASIALVLAFFMKRSKQAEDLMEQQVVHQIRAVESKSGKIERGGEFDHTDQAAINASKESHSFSGTKRQQQGADDEFRQALKGFLKKSQSANDDELFKDTEYRKALQMFTDNNKEEVGDKKYRETLKTLQQKK